MSLLVAVRSHRLLPPRGITRMQRPIPIKIVGPHPVANPVESRALVANRLKIAATGKPAMTAETAGRPLERVTGIKPAPPAGKLPHPSAGGM
jgi:hypothetical protein